MEFLVHKSIILTKKKHKNATVDYIKPCHVGFNCVGQVLDVIKKM
jgi:hypothetical protein